MSSLLAHLFLFLSFAAQVFSAYNPIREYAGETFFEGWSWYDDVDNTTWGNVTYVSSQVATSDRLAYVDSSTGRAIIKVDNVTNVPGPTEDVPHIHRNSVRITTTDAYAIGSLIVIDMVHLPYGCSVWPAFWTLGTDVPEWPEGGEVDIIETINLMTTNQMALHTKPGCVQRLPEETVQSGETLEGDCNSDRGCLVTEKRANAVGPGFAEAGGGVWALQMDYEGFYMWFWSRPDVPESLANANSTSSIEIADFGVPSAAYPARGCDFAEYFTPQQLILTITLCGTWAGVPDIYSQTCQTETNSCVADNIIGAGSPTYDNAYFDINYIRTYFVGEDPTDDGESQSASTGTTTPSGTGAQDSATANTDVPNFATRHSGVELWASATLAVGLVFTLLERLL